MTHSIPNIDPTALACFFTAQLDRFGARADKKGLVALAKALAAVTPGSLSHGDIGRWTQALEALPAVQPSRVELDSARLVIGAERDLSGSFSALEFRAQLDAFIPWRKGPFELFGVDVDTEWRCDLKWARLESAISPLAGRRILDVGSGNGYYAYRMAGAGAKQVLGIDPHVPYVAQFLLLQQYLAEVAVDVLPITLDDFPERCEAFDTAFSMGVLYHRRSPIDHLLQLRDCLRVGGELVLETLYVEGDEGYSLIPQGSYARMRGIWFVPSVATLTAWASKAGFDDVRVVDESVTSAGEQRATSWMPYESLSDSLDPSDSRLSVEGHPAPRRVVIVATKR